MTRIAHIVNPVKVDEDHELYWQQPIVFESMRRAARGDVELWTTGYEEDPTVDGFDQAGLLDRSTLGMEFEIERKLPFLQDILENLDAASNADIFIQTNADIGLMPHFYDAVSEMIEFHDYDSIIINKRILPDYYRHVEDLPLIYSEYGGNHNGYDCFIFRKEIYQNFDLGKVVTGVPWSETTLAMNMLAYSESCRVLKYPHLTWHLGDSRTWMKQHDYRKWNTEAFAKNLTGLLKKKPEIYKSPIVHWYLWKLSVENRPEYCEECHKLAGQLDPMKVAEYQKQGIV